MYNAVKQIDPTVKNALNGERSNLTTLIIRSNRRLFLVEARHACYNACCKVTAFTVNQDQDGKEGFALVLEVSSNRIMFDTILEA